MLDEVKVKANRIKKDDGNFRLYREASHVVDLNKLPYTPMNLVQAIRGKIPSLIIRGTCPNIDIRLRNLRPMLLYDGMILAGDNVKDFLCSLNPANIDKIEILYASEAAIYGAYGLGGVIAVYTKKGKTEPDISKLESYGIEYIKPRAFQRVREFYNPNYSVENDVAKYKDLRTTIFWDPSVITDKQGQAEISFYTADKNAHYNIIVQGVSTDGLMGFKKATIDVKTTN